MKTSVFILFLSLTFCVNLFPQCNQIQDSLELVKFYNEMDGENWTNKWDIQEPMTSWFGIELIFKDGAHCVNSIDLEDNNLEGEIYDLEFPLLKELILGYDNIYGVLPDFSKMPLLSHLHIFSGSISGEIPNFYFLQNLQHLELSFNHLEGIVTSLSNCPELRTYSIADNDLTGPIPKFPDLPELQLFSIKNNQINDTIHNFEENLQLKNVFMSRCGLHGNVPFIKSSNLGLFWASDNEFTGTIPLFNVNSGLKLDLTENRIDSIPSMENLSEFEINCNIVTFDDLFNIDSSAYLFSFSPMDSIPLDVIVYENSDGNYLLNIQKDSDVSTNTYYWFIDGLQVSITDKNILDLTGLSFTTESVWTVEWTNPAFENLILISENFNVDGIFSTDSKDVKNNSFKIFPNPSNGNILISFDFIEDLETRIFDASGKLVYSNKLDDTFNISFLSQGNYIIQFFSRDGELVHIFKHSIVK